MKQILKNGLKQLLLIFGPFLQFLFLRNADKLKTYQEKTKGISFSGMVTEFNWFCRVVYVPFFRRVQVLDTDIAAVKKLKGPIVFVMKNKGQLEYRYFNYLFLKEKISPVAHAKNSFTLFWWPVATIYQVLLCKLDEFYKKQGRKELDGPKCMSDYVKSNENTLLNLSISRDYLFGLSKTNPIETLVPLVEMQNSDTRSIHVVTLQFLYDKHPDKSERSYFDLLFGEKSQPGAIRKFLLFVMNYTRSPRVKFGNPLSLKEFLDHDKEESQAIQSQNLWEEIKSTLLIEKAKITGPCLKAKDVLLKEIMADPLFMDRVHSLAKEQNRKPTDVKKEMGRYLHEIAADVNYSYVQFAFVTLSYIWNNIYDGVVIKHDQLDKVREIAGKNPVVLVPMHRSHIDYLLISYLFFEHDITYPYICAGINLNFWPIGRLVRKCGGFFIRRSFSGNDAYKESLHAYIKSLMASGHCLEFFIEGTRSRTGKLLRPKMGILGALLRAYAEGACDNIYFVPIAVNYDQILEQKVYKKEGTGAEKDKEKASELLKVRRIFNKRYGKVYIDFADPISLKQYCQDHSIKTEELYSNRKDVSDFAYNLTYHMNKAALVTPMSLVSTSILSLNKSTYNVSQIIGRIGLLKEYLDFKGVEFSDMINFSEQFAYNESIKKLCQRGVLKEVDTFEESFYKFEGEHRSDLDYYKNNILHFFVSLTCFCKILNSVENFKTISVDEAVKQFESIKTLFKQDFIFSERSTIRDHLIKVVMYCHEKGFVVFDETKQEIKKTLDQANYDAFAAYHGLLDNFLESHLIGLRYIKHNKVEDVDRKSLIKEIILRGKPMYLKDDLVHPEALSKFNLESSFKVFSDLGVLKESDQDKKKSIYSSIDEPELVDKWISCIQGYLKLMPALGDGSQAAGTQSSSIEEPQELH